MENKLKKIAEIWSLLRCKEKEHGLIDLSLLERDILENLAFITGNDKEIPLETILKECAHPRATFFRSLKKLREKKFIKIVKQKYDRRKSNILLSENINK
tara:strand:+ start:153 stop:452 length:300 start_codon:yes stop_codon:yes gene_type:complete